MAPTGLGSRPRPLDPGHAAEHRHSFSDRQARIARQPSGVKPTRRPERLACCWCLRLLLSPCLFVSLSPCLFPMWHSRIFWRLFGSYALLLLCSISLLGVVMVERVEQQLLRYIVWTLA